MAVDTLADVEDLFAGIDLGAVTTSMTINSPAAILLAMYVARGRERRRAARRPRGHAAERHPEGVPGPEGVHLPAAALDAAGGRRDQVLRGGDAALPPVSVSGYHIREAGSTAAQELAFTLANGFAYVEAAMAAGPGRGRLRPPAQLLLQRPSRLLRGDRQVPRRPPHLGALDGRPLRRRVADRSLQLRFHTQTAGVSLTAQQPEVNIVRTAIEALAGVLGGTQSLHTNSMDEVLALPTEKAARIALRTQQVLAHETGVTNVADPLGGSWFVESLTDEIERQAEAVFARLDEWGEGSMLEGVLHGIETNWFQGEIADAAYQFQRKVAAGPAGRRRGERLHRGERGAGAAHAADRPRGGRGPAQAAGRGPPAALASRPSTPRWPRWPPTPRVAEVNLMPAILDAVRRLRHRRARSWAPWRRSSAAGPRIPSSDADGHSPAVDRTRSY